MADALTVDIVKRYGAVTIEARLEVALAPGGILVLFGPSGSGKTTIVRAIAGLVHPDSGSIRFGDEVWAEAGAGRHVEPQQRRVGYVFQEGALFPHLTVRGNVEYGWRARPSSAAPASVEELIDRLGLAGLAARYPRQLSGGQAQRVALGRALAAAPRLLLLDEPFASLDAPARGALRKLLRASLHERRIPAILVTHDRTEAMALGDQIAVIADGRIRQVGPVADVFRRPADLQVAESVGVDAVLPAQVERVADGLVDLRVGASVLRAVDAGVERRQEVFACIRAEDVTLERRPVDGASARNHLPGRIVSIESDGPLERVTVDCGFPLAALITRSAREELALEPGGDVTAAVKATAIHLVPRL
jgi:molybdate transport system ATP-binding protein